jgi:uncharacterized membrane protein YgcG
MVIRTAAQANLPVTVLAHMLFNVGLDFLLGLVPFLGDLADMAYKANTRNAVVLENYLRERGRENLRKAGLPQQADPSLGEVEEDDEVGVISNQPIAQPQPVYGSSTRCYTGRQREYDPESQLGVRSGESSRHGGSSSKHGGGSSGHGSSKRDKPSRKESSRGHQRLFSQETGVTDGRY